MVTFKIDFELFTLSGFTVEQILSDRFCPLTAPLHLSRFSARSAPFSAPLTLRSNALTQGRKLAIFDLTCCLTIVLNKVRTRTKIMNKSTCM